MKPPRFELSRLADYSDDALLAELRTVAAVLPGGQHLTRRYFDDHARASSDSVIRRFGGWREALEKAGLADRYSGRTVNTRMRTQPTRGATKEEMIRELQRVAETSGTSQVSMPEFDRLSSSMTASGVSRRFGSWRGAVEAAGLTSTPLGNRWTDEDYFENLLTVWTFHGRQPKYAEMNLPPSRITNGAYERKFGTWTKALLAFIDRVNDDADETSPEDATAAPSGRPPMERPAAEPRSIRVGLRYEVLRRDRFRCVLCGASPAVSAGVLLHVDHIVPVARQGATTLDNLRTLCQDCNLGKGARLESPAD